MSDKKNNPTGMRFNKEKMNFVMETENIESPQKVLNFLLEKYWWEKKVGATPIAERQNTVYDAPKLADNFKDEPKQWAEPTPIQQPLDKVTELCQNIYYADSRKEIERYVAQAKKELDWKMQVTINSYAAEIMEKKGFVYND